MSAAARARARAEQAGWIGREVRFEVWRPWARRFELPLGNDSAKAELKTAELAQQGEHRPNQARALVNLGRAQLAAGDLIEAEASFDEALLTLMKRRARLELLHQAGLTVSEDVRAHGVWAPKLTGILRELDRAAAAWAWVYPPARGSS